MDENFDVWKDFKIKLIYIESIKNLDCLLFYVFLLICKGCKIVVIKVGSLESGSCVVLFYMGVIVSFDLVVEVLFCKVGIV